MTALRESLAAADAVLRAHDRTEPTQLSARLTSARQSDARVMRSDTTRGGPLTSSSDLIVHLVESDSPEFAALVSALDAELEHRYPGLSDDGPPPAQDLLAAVVAYCDGAPVGCGALRELEPGVAEIKRMFVSREARRLGAARRILEALEKQGRALGYSAVRLGSGVRQPEALALYDSAGYRRIPLFGEYEGTTLCVCFEKTLAADEARWAEL